MAPFYVFPTTQILPLLGDARLVVAMPAATGLLLAPGTAALSARRRAGRSRAA